MDIAIQLGKVESAHVNMPTLAPWGHMGYLWAFGAFHGSGSSISGPTWAYGAFSMGKFPM